MSVLDRVEIVDEDKIVIHNKNESLGYDDAVTISNRGYLGIEFVAIDNTDSNVVTTFLKPEDIGKVIKFLQEVEKK